MDTYNPHGADKLADGGELLRRRSFIGDRCIALAQDGPWSALERVSDEDRETYARDAIADILTALYGPAGKYDGDDVKHDDATCQKAEVLLHGAMDSWTGDAEDYAVEDDANSRLADAQAVNEAAE